MQQQQHRHHQQLPGVTHGGKKSVAITCAKWTHKNLYTQQQQFVCSKKGEVQQEQEEEEEEEQHKQEDKDLLL
jgi:hypothetical protein